MVTLCARRVSMIRFPITSSMSSTSSTTCCCESASTAGAMNGRAGSAYVRRAATENVVTHERVDELRDVAAPIGGDAGELLHRLGQPVRQLHVLPAQLSHQLHIVIPRQTECGFEPHHDHGQAQHFQHFGPAVHE